MGLIKAALGSAGGVLADQWKEYFYCEAMPANILATKGQKKVTGRSSNTKGDENIITSGSVIAVADGQCMLIVEQGKVVEVCAEPGEFVYDSSTEPSIFSGRLGDNIGQVFANVGKRFTFGGEAPKDQRVYYFNTKELIGNKYGTASPVPFRVVDQRAAIDIDVGIRCFGEYSYHIANPLLFYTNVCGNVSEDYDRASLDSQLKTELLTALQPAFAKISELGIRYSALPGHTTELADALNEALSAKWRDLRGIEVVSFGVSSVTANEEDEKMIKEMQRNAAFMDPVRAAAHLAGATGDAMKTAAANPNGAVGAFMGMGMAGNMTGGHMTALYQQGAQMQQQAAPAPAPAAQGWTCSCGQTGNTGKFCANCGGKKPEAQPEGWTCSCGAVNKGKFCAECGAKKPAGVPQYKCDKCGWEPFDPAHPPKFCPECGDPFDDGDMQ
jgi:membrane protease subunit (stomatin/prohibitin family)